MRHPTWQLLHPRMTLEALGLLPSFLDENDERSAKEQFDTNYPFGGWRPIGAGKVKLTADNCFLYPGDPPQQPLAQTKLRDELIILYRGAFVAIIQSDRSFELARLD